MVEAVPPAALADTVPASRDPFNCGRSLGDAIARVTVGKPAPNQQPSKAF
jgi:hypothetical protein